MESGNTKNPQSQIRWRFSITWNFPALRPRHPLIRATISTNPISPSPTPQQMSLQQLLLQAGDVDANPGPAPRCGVCWKSTSVKTVICCTCQNSIHQSSSGMTRTMQKQWFQANNYQCPNCRSFPSSLILCCK